MLQNKCVDKDVRETSNSHVLLVRCGPPVAVYEC